LNKAAIFNRIELKRLFQIYEQKFGSAPFP